MDIAVGAIQYTPAEAEELLNYLYQYYYARARENGEASELVTAMQELGFAGFTMVLETIINSDEMTKQVQREFQELWEKHLRREATETERNRWENRFRHGRMRAKEQFEQEAVVSKSQQKEAREVINHDYARAQLLLETAVEAGIPDWDVYHDLGLVLKHQEKYGEAIPWFKRAIWGNPDDDFVWSCVELSWSYEPLGQLASGLEFFSEICADKRYYRRWPALHHCGWMCLQLGELHKANDYYRKALEHCRDPSWGWTANDLRHVFERLGDLNEAQPFFLDLTSREPYSENWGAWYARAYVEWKTGDAQRAVMSFDRSVELHRKYWQTDGQYWTLIDYGWCLRDLGRYDEALDRFARAKALDPGKWDGWHGVGWVLKMRQDFAGAKAHFEEALRRNSESAWSWFELGSVYQSLGADPRNLIYAWEAYEKTLVIGATNESAGAAAREANNQLEENGIPWKPLRRFIEKAYDLEELRTLCFELGIEYENLVGGKSARIVQLVEFCQRHSGKTLALIRLLHEERSNGFPPLVAGPRDRK